MVKKNARVCYNMTSNINCLKIFVKKLDCGIRNERSTFVKGRELELLAMNRELCGFSHLLIIRKVV